MTRFLRSSTSVHLRKKKSVRDWCFSSSFWIRYAFPSSCRVSIICLVGRLLALLWKALQCGQTVSLHTSGSDETVEQGVSVSSPLGRTELVFGCFFFAYFEWTCGLQKSAALNYIRRFIWCKQQGLPLEILMLIDCESMVSSYGFTGDRRSWLSSSVISWR